MATLALAAAGAAIGSAALPAGVSLFGATIAGATIGQAVGSVAGSVIDQALFGSTQRVSGPQLTDLSVQASTEGAPIPRVFGSMRLAGQVIWAADYREDQTTERQGGKAGGGGGGASVETTTYTYFASFAVGLCEGNISGIGRVWADGDLVDTDTLPMTIYLGDDTQQPDPTISSIDSDAPAYRGTAYVVFDNLPLADYGDRVPQMTFEILRRPLIDAANPVLPDLARSVAMIPGSGEFILGTTPVRREGGSEGAWVAENVHAAEDRADISMSLDQLQQSLPAVTNVSLVTSWFGDDLRAGSIQFRPGVERPTKTTEPYSWAAGGVDRSGAYLIGRDSSGSDPAYGGTPADRSVVEAVSEIKSRGLSVTFYPFTLMDISSGNALPDPYGGDEQAAYPWRGRITSANDGTAAVADEVEDFFGTAQPSDFGAYDGDTVPYYGPEEWSYRRMILHQAHLAKAAGGVDAFLIGSEMRGLTTLSSTPGVYPAVAALRQLAADVKGILPNAAIGYAADWSEYFGHHPGDGSGSVYFHLDPLWADNNIDFIGIDNYVPLSDWRHGGGLDGQIYASPYDSDYLSDNIAGGEGYDWFYASHADREAQTRTPITDGAYGEPWVFRYKDFHGWWSNPHHNRPGGSRDASPTAWVPGSKPIRFTELGYPAVDAGTNQPNVFYDPKSTESALPYYSTGARDDASQRAGLEATLKYWADPANNPAATLYSGRMIDTAETSLWAWDARPWPVFPRLTSVWDDGDNYERGHWLNGRAAGASLSETVTEICTAGGETRIDVAKLHGVVQGYAMSAPTSARQALQDLSVVYGFDAVESAGVIRFVPRGGSATLSLTADDLVGDLERTRAQETDLPRETRLNYLQSDADGRSGTVSAMIPAGSVDRVASLGVSVALDHAAAHTVAERALSEAWVGRETARFSLPPSRLSLEPGDVAALDSAEWRVTEIADGEVREISAVRVEPHVYVAGAPSAPRRSAIAPVSVPAPATFEVLDLPRVTGDETSDAPLLAATASPWPGRVAVYRSSGDAGFELDTILTSPATMGVLVDDLPSGDPWRLQRAQARVRLARGALESRTVLDVANGANVAALKTPSGAWEVAQFTTAELTNDGSYAVSGWLRGQRGSDALVTDLPKGTRFVLLNQALERSTLSPSAFGLARTWRVGPARLSVGSDLYRAETLTVEGVGLRPFAPAHLTAARSGGDLTLSWRRRPRIGGDGWETEPPLIEPQTRFQVTISQNGAVIHSAKTSSETYVYANAPTGSLTIAVAQIGDAFGAGPAAQLEISP